MPAGAAGRPLKDDVDDFTLALPGYAPGRFPTTEAFELPCMTNSAEVGARATWDFFNKYSMKEFAGIKLLATWAHDDGHMHTNGRPSPHRRLSSTP